jgi:hypothetical protein
MKTLTRAFVIAIWIMAISYAAHAQSLYLDTVVVDSSNSNGTIVSIVVYSPATTSHLRLTCTLGDYTGTGATNAGAIAAVGCILPTAGMTAKVTGVGYTSGGTLIQLSFKVYENRYHVGNWDLVSSD